jgi:hypothetical protein
MTPLEFEHERDQETESWARADPRAALIERRAWNRWLVTLPGGDTHLCRLEREHGAYLGDCDCAGFEFHDGPCAHLCTLRKAEFLGESVTTTGHPVETFDQAQERADSLPNRALSADGGVRR